MAQVARALLIAACIAAPGLAFAGKTTSKVTIETDPPGAKVFFNDKEDGEVCTTPCTIDAPVGETTVIIEAENRRSLFETLVVHKSTKPIKVQYKLEPAIGALVVQGAAGATIKIDGEAKGVAPRRIESVPAGAHRVVLEQNGAAIYDQFLEIEAGGEATVTAATAAPPPSPPPSEPAALTTRAPSPRTAPEVAVSAVFDAGFRQFTYRDNKTPDTQRDDRETGQLLAGPAVELWPAALLDLDYLHGLALYARIELGLNQQPVTIDEHGQPTSTMLTTAWRSLEISLHQRWTFGDAALEIGGGFAQDSYQFKNDDALDAKVPDATYSVVRIGARGSLQVGPLEPYLAGETRIVLSGGELADRYSLGASAEGFRGQLGVVARSGPFEARAEGSLTRYSWTFHADSGALEQASGGTDFIQQVTVAVGYRY